MNDDPYATPRTSPTETAAAAPLPPPHALSESAQRRNSLVFLLNNSISYFVAPVFYVGVLHAVVIERLGLSDTVANLPESVYMWMLPLPVFIAWLWPSTRHVKTMLVVNYAAKGLAGLAAVALFLGAPTSWLAAGLIAHAGIVGVTTGVTNMCLWEVIGRGMTPARRGWTLGITFGIGPLFAVLGSCLSQLTLTGSFLGLMHMPKMPEPWGYVVLFGITAPAMALSAAFVSLVSLPAGAVEPRASLASMAGGLRQYFAHPPILIALGGFLLTAAGGNMILANLALYARDATGHPPDEYAGWQLALRFGSKSVAGFLLGWLVARLSPKMPAVATTAFCLVGMLWALLVPGEWYLASFCFLGAGELFYVYYLNYIVGCSRPERMKENTAYTNVISAAVGFVPLIYGGLSDRYGLRSSFVLAAGILIAALALVTLLMPRRPKPPAVE